MKWVLFAFTLPWTLLTWLLGALSLILFVAKKPRFEGAAILTLEFREWFARGRDGKGLWRYSTTLGRTIWWQPGSRDAKVELDERIERHERIHVRQIEDLMMLSFMVGAGAAIPMWVAGNTAGGFALWFCIWFSGGLWQLPNFLTAMMRFGPKNGYRDSEHERSAYSRTDLIEQAHVGKSWCTIRQEAREADWKRNTR